MNATIADRVSSAKNSPNAIIGNAFIHGIGFVMLFTDIESRDAYDSHVIPKLTDKGAYQDITSNGEPVSVVWGLK